jgi:hypothetical protein
VSEQRAAPAKKHLVFDEVETFTSNRGSPHDFRVRVWRSEGATPVVLVQQTNGDCHPNLLACKVANWVYQAVLGCHEHGMLYFEAYRGAFSGCWAVDQQLFEHAGRGDRLRYHSPMSRKKDVAHLEWLVGGPVEL